MTTYFTVYLILGVIGLYYYIWLEPELTLKDNIITNVYVLLSMAPFAWFKLIAEGTNFMGLTTMGDYLPIDIVWQNAAVLAACATLTFTISSMTKKVHLMMLWTGVFIAFASVIYYDAEAKAQAVKAEIEWVQTHNQKGAK